MSYTNEQIKQKCLEYDKINNSFPESEWEGMCLYYFITKGKEETSSKAWTDWEDSLKGI